MAPVKRALVTGGAGFIGSHLCDFLIERGWEVTALDDFSSGAAQNLVHLEGEATFRLVRGDFSDGALMDRWVPWASAVFHLAAMASAPQSLQDPQQCFQRNVEAFKDLLLRLRDHPVPLVYASSAAVYGENAGPCREDQIPRPLTPYGASKAMDEMMAATAWRCWKIPSVGLRFFNVYGPRQNPRGPYGSVVAKFCRNTIRRERPQVFGDGLQTRDYVFVGDLVPVVLWAAETPEAFGRVLNVASGRALSIKDLLEILGRLGTPLEPQFLPARPGDIRHSWADVSALRQLGAPAPKLALEEGLARTLEFFREARDGEDRQRELP